MTSAHLLLLDDDLEMGVIVGVLARKAGHRLTRCRDVESAWKALRQSPPDLTLLDVNLPGESGLALLRRLRGDASLAPLRVALFCQSGLAGDIAAGWALGADYLMPKELVCEPVAWSERLGELLAHAAGQPPDTSVQFHRGPRLAGAAPWEEALNRAGEEPLLRTPGAEVIEQLLRRALTRGLGRVPEGCLSAGRIITPGPFCAATPEQVERVLASFVDQVWCLLGPRASRACADRLWSALESGGETSPRSGRA
jgi:CheY-like chemotaxis protein